MSAQITAEALAPSLLDMATQPRVAPAQPALFLHTGWRSSGTWIWSRLREDPAVMAFYEPLHEQLATLNGARIARLRPGAWNSGHSFAAPYYSEFRDLLARRGRGVALYQERFAADRFFLEQDARDPALHAYIDSLIGHAREAGRVPVLKFCRSLGRVGWMRQHFPDAMHAVVLRDPQAQWRSARQQLANADNRYFLIGPLLILARNATNPLVAEACIRLGVKLPALPTGGNLSFDQEICWRHLAKLGWADRYRSFLAYWTASAITALQDGVLAIDSDDLLDSEPHRNRVEAAILSGLGFAVSLKSAHHVQSVLAPLGETASEQETIAGAHACAIELLRSRGASLPEASHARIMSKLTPALTAKARGSVAFAWAPALSHIPQNGWRQALYFGGLRLSMPLRRLHGHAKRILPK